MWRADPSAVAPTARIGKPPETAPDAVTSAQRKPSNSASNCLGFSCCLPLPPHRPALPPPAFWGKSTKGRRRCAINNSGLCKAISPDWCPRNGPRRPAANFARARWCPAHGSTNLLHICIVSF